LKLYTYICGKQNQNTMQLETNIQTLEPVLFTKLNADRIGKLKVRKAIALMELIGYDKKQLMRDKLIFEAAQRELAYRVKYN